MYIHQNYLLKKLFAIGLLSICLFNLAGYSWLFDYLEAKSDRQLIQKLDLQQYRDEELIEIKFPFQVPYNNDWHDYRREDGEIEIQGRFYSYVKIKISQDTIYLKCLPNTGKNNLILARQKVNKKLNNLPGGDEESTSLFKKASLLFGFSQSLPTFTLYIPQHTIHRCYPRYQSKLINGYCRENLHPPSA